MDTIPSVILRTSPQNGLVVAFLSVIFSLASCGDAPEPRTMGDILSEVEGTRLSDAETATLLETADLLCALNADVLTQTLPAVNPERLNYLDWVFAEHCPDRAGLYQGVLAESFPEHVQNGNS